MYDQRDTNGTELRAVSGNFPVFDRRQRIRRALHCRAFRLPVMGTTIELDGVSWCAKAYWDVFG